ncbi:MAG: hypothetical protein HY962_01635 [Ignavibacteriae bacterium]|nr:hypothetical protein [Ignavibacteriota bacterium]
MKKSDPELCEAPKSLIPSLQYILTVSLVDRHQDISTDRWYRLDRAKESSAGVWKGVFVSGKHSHRPPLVNRKTGSERPNPKTLDESEKELTHFALAFFNDEIGLLLEERRSGVSVDDITYYLNWAVGVYYGVNQINCDWKIVSMSVPSQGFINEINKMKRVSSATLFVSKDLLSSQFLRFSKRTESVAEELELKVPSKLRKDIKQLAVDMARAHKKKLVARLRVSGTSRAGSTIILDTGKLRQKDYIKTEVDETTGIVKSEPLLNTMEKIVLERW